MIVWHWHLTQVKLRASLNSCLLSFTQLLASQHPLRTSDEAVAVHERHSRSPHECILKHFLKHFVRQGAPKRTIWD
jgi:hypothetical protein